MNNTGPATGQPVDHNDRRKHDGNRGFEDAPVRKRSVGFDLAANNYLEPAEAISPDKKMKVTSFDDNESLANDSHLNNDNMESNVGDGIGIGNGADSPYPDATNLAAEVEEEEQVTEDEKKWEEFLEDKRARGEVKNCEGLDIFLKGKKRWEHAIGRLGGVLENFEDAVTGKVDKVCTTVVRSIYSSKQNELNELSANCKSLLIQNQQRRTKLLKTLKKADKAWKATHKSLMAQALDEESSEEEDDVEVEESPEEGSGEVNEDRLLDECLNDGKPERARIAQLYCQAQQRKEEAEQHFASIISRAEETWKGKFQSAIEMAIEIHAEQEHHAMALDGYIRREMVANNDRGIEYTKKLQEAQEARQAFYSNLLNKVHNKGGKGKAMCK